MGGQGKQIARYGKRVLGYTRFIPEQSHEAHWKTSRNLYRLNMRNERWGWYPSSPSCQRGKNLVIEKRGMNEAGVVSKKRVI